MIDSITVGETRQRLMTAVTAAGAAQEAAVLRDVEPTCEGGPHHLLDVVCPYR